MFIRASRREDKIIASATHKRTERNDVWLTLPGCTLSLNTCLWQLLDLMELLSCNYLNIILAFVLRYSTDLSFLVTVYNFSAN